MEEIKKYKVEITFHAERNFFDILDYFHKTISYEAVEKKGEELYALANSLAIMPERGHRELVIQNLGKEYRYLLYKVSSRTMIKVIYFVDKEKDTVHVTDFFPCEMDNKKIEGRSA